MFKEMAVYQAQKSYTFSRYVFMKIRKSAVFQRIFYRRKIFENVRSLTE